MWMCSEDGSQSKYCLTRGQHLEKEQEEQEEGGQQSWESVADVCIPEIFHSSEDKLFEL